VADAPELLRDEEAAGSNPATPTMKLQVAVLFRGEFRLPIPAAFRFWERTGRSQVSAAGRKIVGTRGLDLAVTPS
jgi:hypothetical protein